MARQFFDGSSSQGPMAQPSLPMPLHMAPPPELAQGVRAGPPPPDLGAVWNGMPNGQAMHVPEIAKTAGPSGWASEFEGASRVVGPASAGPAMQHATAPQMPCMYPSAKLEIYSDLVIAYQAPYMGYQNYSTMSSVGYIPYYAQQNASVPQSLDKGKGKGKSRDIDFEAAFAQITASLASDQTESSARIVEVDDNVASLSDALQNTTLTDAEQRASEKRPEFKEYVSSSPENLACVDSL